MYLSYCKEFSDVRIDLAHGHFVKDAVHALHECPNVWIDISFMELEEIKNVWAVAPDRVMYGSDFPAPLRYWNHSCTQYMRREIEAVQKLGGDDMLRKNALMFLKGGYR